MEIYSSQYAVMMEVIAKSGVNVSEIAGIGITNQRETTILWLRHLNDLLFLIEQDRSGTGCPLVERKDIALHLSTSFRILPPIKFDK